MQSVCNIGCFSNRNTSHERDAINMTMILWLRTSSQDESYGSHVSLIFLKFSFFNVWKIHSNHNLIFKLMSFVSVLYSNFTGDDIMPWTQYSIVCKVVAWWELYIHGARKLRVWAEAQRRRGQYSVSVAGAGCRLCLVFSFELGAEYLDELSLVRVDVALHHFHARTEQSLERRHVQHYLRNSLHIPVTVVTVPLKSNLSRFIKTVIIIWKFLSPPAQSRRREN